MSAAPIPREPADLIRLGYADLPEVDAIEQRAYPFPWTLGNLRDSLDAGHLFVGLSSAGELVAYAILMSVIDEAHLLNLTVAPEHQGLGWGGDMLRECLRLAAADLQARSILLEVRPSNAPALALYHRAGFRPVGRRRAYYPARAGREDALVLRRMLP
jgi:ribosomal-protein-alanine N-acetyltransferase